MLIIHENMGLEAQAVASAIEHAYHIPTIIVESDVEDCFRRIATFKHPCDRRRACYAESDKQVFRRFAPLEPDAAKLILTTRDIYAGRRSQHDDWVLGYNVESIFLSVVSAARMRRPDNQPSKELKVPVEQYLRRLQAMSVHEIGHDLVANPAFRNASWVSTSTGDRLPLGPHCTDNTCVMYEVVDITTPPRQDGYLQLGRQRKYDAGLDEHLTRLCKDWLCGPCRENVQEIPAYRRP